MKKTTLLGKMKVGSSGTIHTIHPAPYSKRLLEMGLVEGSKVHVAFEAPFTRDPIAIKVRGALIAIRRAEANLIEVEL